MNKRNEQGFTLIELLVVVAIIGILAAIAIPQYATYKQQAADSKAKSDLHNMATAMEAYYGSNGNSYGGATVGHAEDVRLPSERDVNDSVATADSTSYTLSATPTGGTDSWPSAPLVVRSSTEANPRTTRLVEKRGCLGSPPFPFKGKKNE